MSPASSLSVFLLLIHGYCNITRAVGAQIVWRSLTTGQRNLLLFIPILGSELTRWVKTLHLSTDRNFSLWIFIQKKKKERRGSRINTSSTELTECNRMQVICLLSECIKVYRLLCICVCKWRQKVCSEQLHRKRYRYGVKGHSQSQSKQFFNSYQCAF